MRRWIDVHLCTAISSRIVLVRAFAVGLAAGFSISGTAWADATRDTLSEISKCSAIDDNTDRLRCFDRVAPRARAALEPNVQDFGKPPAPPIAPEVEQVTATVHELSRSVRGRAVFVLDNGQTWRQIDGDDARVTDLAPADAPLTVTIARGLFGSYNLTIHGRNGIMKVRRVE